MIDVEALHADLTGWSAAPDSMCSVFRIPSPSQLTEWDESDRLRLRHIPGRSFCAANVDGHVRFFLVSPDLDDPSGETVDAIRWLCDTIDVDVFHGQVGNTTFSQSLWPDMAAVWEDLPVGVGAHVRVTRHAALRWANQQEGNDDE